MQNLLSLLLLRHANKSIVQREVAIAISHLVEAARDEDPDDDFKQEAPTPSKNKQRRKRKLSIIDLDGPAYKRNAGRRLYSNKIKDIQKHIQYKLASILSARVVIKQPRVIRMDRVDFRDYRKLVLSAKKYGIESSLHKRGDFDHHVTKLTGLVGDGKSDAVAKRKNIRDALAVISGYKPGPAPNNFWQSGYMQMIPQSLEKQNTTAAKRCWTSFNVERIRLSKLWFVGTFIEFC